ncbi:LAMI_0C10000g1_1 [Lachancea mirantina]|uniref:LAMI_0C10000g1_1 n=1 Tax=Lachancea mirantina TaxID=1230905 RepID=A0A1G4J685_9SACH|nr:LAMI_0C10000g1_1 [Lachancea mirantina]
MSSNLDAKKRSNLKRPDVGVRDKKLEVLNAQLKKVDTEVQAIRKQIDQHQLGSGAQDERSKLHQDLRDIIKVQSDLKSRRQTVHDKIRSLDSDIKRKDGQISAKIGTKSRYQSVDEIKSRIAEIDADVSSGQLSLVQEKLHVKEMQSLNKLIKDFQAVDPIKKSIDQDRASIASLKQELNEMNPREVSAKFEATQKKLNDVQSKNQVVYDKRQTLFAKRSALYKKRDEIYSQINQIRSDFDNEFQAFKGKLEKERLKREEDQKLSKLLEEKDTALGKLQEKLLHARQPAFTYEIGAIENVLVVLDPTYVKPKKQTLEALASTSEPKAEIKKVEADDLVPIVKEKEEFFAGGSKSKKNKKKQSSNSTKFSLEPTMIALLAELDVAVPLSKEEVPKTVEQLKAKHEELSSKQDEQTEKNISAAEKQIKDLELSFEKKEEQVKKELEEKRAAEKKEDD